MKEREQTEKWLYSTSGKLARGLLCMLTFCAFTAGLAFTVYSVLHYGSQILHVPKADYFQSKTYQMDISNEVSSLLYSLMPIYENGENTEFSITDVEKRTITFYDLITMVRDSRNGMSIEDIMYNKDRYRVRTLKSGFDFYEHDQMQQYLNSNLTENNFLFFSEKAFKDLFIADGYRNINHIYSEDFSESAYFIFYDMNFMEMTDEEKRETFDVHYDYTNEGEVEESSVHILSSVDISSVDYAVYDPKENLYYSTKDDYFEPMGSYIYNTSDLISRTGRLDEYSGSMICPLLDSDNLDNSGIWNRLNQASESNIELAKISELDDSAFYYYIKNSQYEKSNVEGIEDIASVEYAYRLIGDKVYKNQIEYEGIDMKVDENLQDVEKLELYSQIIEAFRYLPQDTVFYFGINTEHTSEDDSSQLIQSYRQYNRSANSLFVAIITAIIFILLLLQAGILIYTTGKRAGKDKRITLNSFDGLPTELWILICAGILVSCVWFAMKVLPSYYNYTDVRKILIPCVLATVPFGFFFMVLTLSFARRTKAHNIWERSIFFKSIKPISSRKRKEPRQETAFSQLKKLVRSGREYFRNMKGTDKLLILFAGYVILEGICWFLPRRGLAVGIFLLLNIAALAVIIYIIKDLKELTQGVTEITKGNLDYKVSVNEKNSLFRELNDGINHIGDGIKAAVETSIKDERMKTELITNVSHDLKTPLTSIINYINLLKTEKMPTSEAEHYVEVLESKAQRLRHLTEDLVEAAKATSGNIELEKMPLAFNELMKQALGEFEDKFATRDLEVIVNCPEEPAMILADGRRMFRIIENILQNAYKYALPGTRIYADLSNKQSVITFILKNISAAPLNISPEELMERFTRGDSARTTEGSGLGLSIAKDLTRLQDGTFDIILDGDLFKVIITFPEYIKTQDEAE